MYIWMSSDISAVHLWIILNLVDQHHYTCCRHEKKMAALTNWQLIFKLLANISEHATSWLLVYSWFSHLITVNSPLHLHHDHFHKGSDHRMVVWASVLGNNWFILLHFTSSVRIFKVIHTHRVDNQNIILSVPIT